MDLNERLLRAIRDSSVETVRAEIEAGAKVNIRNQYQMTPLHFAARFNFDPAVIEILLEAGAKINALNLDLDSEPWTPFNETFDMTETGADVNARDKWKNTPLHWAAKYNSPKVMNTLIRFGARVDVQNEDGKTPLDFAKTVLEEKRRGVQLLKAYQPTKEIEMSIHEAIQHEPSLNNIVKLILDGADIHVCDKNKWTPLHWAVTVDREWNHSIIRALITANVDINAKDKDGNTALNLAVQKDSDPEVVRILIDGGAENTINNEGRSAYDMAKYGQNQEIYKLIKGLVYPKIPTADL